MSSEVVNASETPQENGWNEEIGSPSAEGNTSGKADSGKASADSKICGVCGDKALGNNFNAITCESCKAFFRRNALRTKEFVCPFSNSCKVDAITRRFCQRCRLKKCFDIGMKKEWIMTEDEKRLKKQKIEQNRLKRSSLENSTGSGGRGDDDDPDVPAAKLQRSSSPDSSNHDGQEEMNEDSLENSKVHKLPMRVQNQNELSANKKGKDNRTNVIAIAVSTGSPQSQSAPEQFSPGDGHEYELETRQQIQYQLPEVPAPMILPTWKELDGNDGDSSSSNASSVISLAQPLVKYVPPKKQKLFGKEEILGIGHDTDNQPVNQMPLLSSLIRPGYPESSPDHSNSPPVALISLKADCDDNIRAGEAIARNDITFYSHISTLSPQAPMILPHSPPVGMYRHNEASDINHSIPHTITSFDHHPHQPHHFSNEIKNYPVELESRQNYAGLHPHHHDPPKVEQSHEVMALPLNTMDSILSVAIAAEFNAFGMLGTNTSRELNKAEQAKLNELLVAGQALHAPVDAERPIKVSETSDPSLLNVINLTEIAIRRLIKMSKKISGFKNMCQEDQIALLKGGCTEMMILRSVVTYDPLKDSWEIPHSNPGQYNIQLGVLKEARGNLYEEHQRFVKSFRAQWRKDENIMTILCAITLFTPERLNVIHKDVVKLEQDSYYYLLKRYLESILNGCEAKSTYLQLIRKVAELRALNSSHVRVFLEMNPKEVEPLLIEIFDLK